jgi:serine protease Do
MNTKIKNLIIWGVIVLLSTMITGFTQASWSKKDEAVDPIKDQPFTFKTFSEIAKTQSPTVVNISTTTIIKQRSRQNQQPFDAPEPFGGDDFFKFFFGPRSQSQKLQSLGSGVIIDSEGYILTNNHVVEDVDEIQVKTLDGKTYQAKVIGTDQQTDVALIKIEPETTLTAIPFGNSDQIEVGDWVMAIGNPFGFDHTVTVGVVSAKGRSFVMPQEELPYQDFIQTDASINPGNSGGPLLDVAGRLIGINTVIASRTGQSAGIGFAIPVNMINDVLYDLKDKGSVTRGWLGISIQTITDELKDAMKLTTTQGAIVSEIMKDSPASEGGLETGDVITHFDGVEIKDSAHLSRTVAHTAVDKDVKVKVLRKGKEKTLTIKIGKKPEDIKNMKNSAGVSLNLGMTVTDITPELSRQMGLKDVEGVVVSNIDAGGAADRAGLIRGDIILEVNQTKIKSIKEYRAIVEKLESGKSAVLYILRGETRHYLVVKPKSEK